MNTRIAIDVGHANGTGARGQGYEEHAVCARIAPHLVAALDTYGIDADIIDDPELDNRHDLTLAVERINAGNYALGVSLHADAAAKDGAYAHGGHVCYVSGEGGVLAAHIAYRLVQLMPGRADRTVRRSDLYVLKKTHPVHVLIECGFITHPHDAELMAQHPEEVAAVIARGVFDYVTARRKDDATA